MNSNEAPEVHAVAKDAGRNRHCTCGAEYTWAANLMAHITRENNKKEGE